MIIDLSARRSNTVTGLRGLTEIMMEFFYET